MRFKINELIFFNEYVQQPIESFFEGSMVYHFSLRFHSTFGPYWVLLNRCVEACSHVYIRVLVHAKSPKF